MANVNHQAVESALQHQLLFIKSLDTDNQFDFTDNTTKQNIILSLFCSIFEGTLEELNEKHEKTFFDSTYDTCLTLMKELLGEEVSTDIEQENKKLLEVMAWAYQAWMHNLNMSSSYDNVLETLKGLEEQSTEEVVENVEETV